MGSTAGKELVRKLDLERILQQAQPHPSPKAFLEQYTMPVDIASEILFLAAYVHDDIVGKTVADLGCGTGRLALGAAFLGATDVVGIDIDKTAIRTAKESATELDLNDHTDWIVGDINILRGCFDTVLQNPPFGVQKRSADRKFLLIAMKSAQKIYSLHKAGESNRTFLKKFIEKHEGKVTSIFQMKLNIPRLFKFHTKRKHEVRVDLYRIESQAGKR